MLWLVGPVLPTFVWSESQEWFLHFLNGEKKKEEYFVVYGNYIGLYIGIIYRKLTIQCP